MSFVRLYLWLAAAVSVLAMLMSLSLVYNKQQLPQQRCNCTIMPEQSGIEKIPPFPKQEQIKWRKA